MSTFIPTLPLSGIAVRAVIARDVIACPPGASLASVASLMDAEQIHAVAVDEDLPRLITALDVVRAAVAGGDTTATAIARAAPAVWPDDSLRNAAKRMVRERADHLVVRGCPGEEPPGVISSYDLVAVLAGREPHALRSLRAVSVRRALGGGPLDRRALRDVMHRGVITCRPDATMAQLARVLSGRRVHTLALPRDEGWAFISDLDVLDGVLHGALDVAARDLRSVQAPALRADDTLDVAAGLMAENPVGHVVVDDGDVPVGVVSALDLVGVIAES